MAAFLNTLFLQADLLRAARRMSENTEKLSDLIKTIRSDEDYPWPPSKAPWAVELGGTGIPPSGARENFGKNKFKLDRIRDLVNLWASEEKSLCTKRRQVARQEPRREEVN